MTLRYGSVCSGVEAVSLAWEPLGMAPAWFAEVDPFCRSVLAHRWPGVPNLGDITDADFVRRARGLGPIDILVGGTPCQAFSTAGKRRGLDDARGNLTLRFIKIAGEIKPRWVVWENVPGVLSLDGGRVFGAVLGGLAGLGYRVAYRICDAQHWGVAQRRKRVFVVGRLGGGCPGAVLFEPEGQGRDSQAGGEAGAGAAGTAAAGAGAVTRAVFRKATRPHSTEEAERWEESEVASTLNGWEERFNPPPHLVVGFDPQAGTMDVRAGDTAPTLKSGHGCGNKVMAVAYTVGLGSYPLVARDMPQPVTTRNGDPGVVAYQCHGSNVGPMGTLRRGNGEVTGGVPFTVVAAAFGGNDTRGPIDVATACNAHRSRHDFESETFVVFQQNQRDEVRLVGGDGQTCGALAADVGVKQQNYVVTPRLIVRRLTPRETERLQGMPDDHTLVPHRGKPAVDGPRYKAVGNSMAVPVVRWIGGRLLAVDRGELPPWVPPWEADAGLFAAACGETDTLTRGG